MSVQKNWGKVNSYIIDSCQREVYMIKKKESKREGRKEGREEGRKRGRGGGEGEKERDRKSVV